MADYEQTARRVTRYAPEKFRRDQARVEAGFWDKARRALGRVSFLEDAAAAYYCALDPATPTRVKAILLGALAYFVLPTDMIPDIVAGLGFVDDAAVLAYAYRQVAEHVTGAHRERARTAMAQLRGDSRQA